MLQLSLVQSFTFAGYEFACINTEREREWGGGGGGETDRQTESLGIRS